MHAVAFDESGNTGADLLNQQQPVFALASTCLSRDQANLILEPLTTPQTREIKFSRLRRTEAGRRRIIEFLSCSSLDPENTITTLFHKKYMIVTKVVDLLVENLAHEDGIDLYRGRGQYCDVQLLLFLYAHLLRRRSDNDFFASIRGNAQIPYATENKKVLCRRKDHVRALHGSRVRSIPGSHSGKRKNDRLYSCTQRQKFPRPGNTRIRAALFIMGRSLWKGIRSDFMMIRSRFSRKRRLWKSSCRRKRKYM